MNISDMVAEYITLRNEVAEKKKEFDDFKKSHNNRMVELELSILEVSQETGVNSFKTEFGTAYKTIKKYATNADREAREEYARKTGDFGLFTNHVNKAHLIELMEMDEEFDPESVGINYSEEQAINIRKS